MGLRGPQPTLKLRSEPLTDLAAPEWLSKDAAAFYSKHAKQLQENQLLTVQTADAFALACDLWARVQQFKGKETSRAYLDTVKAFLSAVKPFRLVPNEKPHVKEDRFADFTEVDID
jgi:phage terminase small subunit